MNWHAMHWKMLTRDWEKYWIVAAVCITMPSQNKKIHNQLNMNWNKNKKIPYE